MFVGRIMKQRFILCSAFIFISAMLSYGQCIGHCTSVTGTITDPSAQVWANAIISANIVPPFGIPLAQLLNNGVPINDPVVTLTANGSGVFNISLDTTTSLAPLGANWKFTICPNASVSNCYTLQIPITGVSEDISSAINAVITPPSVNALQTLSRGYTTTEVNSGQGGLFWNTLNNGIYGCAQYQCNGSGWTPINIVATVTTLGPATGSLPGNIAPLCIVDGTHFATIASCMTYLTAQGLSGGEIWSFVPEEFTYGYFALSNWRGVVWLAANITNNTGNTGQGTPAPTYLTDGPLVLPSNLRLVGLNTQVRQTVPVSGGTIISFSTLFPSVLNAPATPTVTGSTTGGNITCASAPCTYYVQIDNSNNLLGSGNNDNAQATPGHSAVSAETTFTISSNTTTGSASFTPATLQTSSNTLFNGQDIGVYTSLTSGQEVENDNAIDLVCPVVGVVDKDGCNGSSLASIKITNIPVTEGANVNNRMPPCYRASNNDTSSVLVDCSNPLVYFGTGIPGQINGTITPNTFDVQLRSLALYGSPTGNNAPSANEPAIAWLDGNAQDNSGLFDVLITGSFGCSGACGVTAVMMYAGFKSGDSFLEHVHVPSNAGPNTGTMVDLILDGRPGGNGSIRSALDLSINGSGNGGGTPTVPYRILATGAQSNTSIHDIHCETLGDCIFLDNGAGGSFEFSSSTVPLGFASVHTSVTADVTCAYINKEADTHPAWKDDLTGFTLVPGQSLGARFCSKQYGTVDYGFGYGATSFPSAGVTANLLAKQNNTGKAVVAVTTDQNVTGIATVSITNGAAQQADIAIAGQFKCQADNTISVNDLVGVGTTTGGACKDLGSADQTTISPLIQVVGRALTAATAGNLSNILLFGPGHYGQNNSQIYNCSTTSTCSATLLTSPRIFQGSAPLVTGTPSTVTITGFSPIYTSTNSYHCTATDATNAANNLLKVVNTSTSSITITGPNTITDTVNYICVGN